MQELNRSADVAAFGQTADVIIQLIHRLKTPRSVVPPPVLLEQRAGPCRLAMFFQQLRGLVHLSSAPKRFNTTLVVFQFQPQFTGTLKLTRLQEKRGRLLEALTIQGGRGLQGKGSVNLPNFAQQWGRSHRLSRGLQTLNGFGISIGLLVEKPCLEVVTRFLHHFRRTSMLPQIHPNSNRFFGVTTSRKFFGGQTLIAAPLRRHRNPSMFMRADGIHVGALRRRWGRGWTRRVG
jgi:hypothetical protein